MRVFENFGDIVGSLHGRMLLLLMMLLLLLLLHLMLQLRMERVRHRESGPLLRWHHESGHGSQRRWRAVDMRLIIRFGFGVVLLRLASQGVVGRGGARGLEGIGDGVVSIRTGGFGKLVERIASKRSEQ